jgi:hypothetical protein
MSQMCCIMVDVRECLRVYEERFLNLTKRHYRLCTYAGESSATIGSKRDKESTIGIGRGQDCRIRLWG